MNSPKNKKPKVNCKICGNKIPTSKLKKHLTTCRENQDEEDLFICAEPGCGKPFETKKYLVKHISRTHSALIECPHPGCDVMLKAASLKPHIKQIHERERDECTNCGRKVYPGYLKTHMQICSSDGSRPYKCEEKGCKSTFKTAHQRSSHKSNVHSEPIECPFPDCKAAMKKSSLILHIRRVHDKLKEKCDACGKEVPYGTLSQHKKLCNIDPSRPFKCLKVNCKLRFGTEEERASHISKDHSKKVECPSPHCDAIVMRRGLRLHMKQVHSQTKRQCENCGKKVSHFGYYEHSKLCSGDGSKSFQCTEDGCEKAFKTVAQRLNHVLTVHSEPIECPFPDCKAVIKRATLPKHVRVVHDKMKEKCEKCGKEVVYGYMARHKASCFSDGSKTFECQEKDCDKAFTTRGSLSQHTRNVHGETIQCPFPKCKAVMTRGALWLHKKGVHYKVKEECGKCGKKFGPVSLKAHAKRCTVGKSHTFKCMKRNCKSTFKTDRQRTIHVRKMHSTM